MTSTPHEVTPIPIDTSNRSRSLKSRKLTLPLKETHRSSALSHRPLCDESTQRQIKLSEKLLPKLYLRELSRPRKKSFDVQKSHLQQWINNELEDDQTQGQGQLKAIRKYQIDKKCLMNMQISSQEVDKLYQTLYVYSHGVKNAFLELIGKNNQQLMIRFWRVYILLLEDKNVSTMVQKRHQQSLDIVMRTLKATEREVQSLKRITAEKQKKLSKQIIQKEDQIQKIKEEKDIIESNLLLTDQAFNEEVGRRLQFQQKINEINTIHNQLKSKHRRLVEELEVFQKIDADSKQSKKTFEIQRKNFEIKTNNLQKQVVELKERLKQSEQDSNQMKDEIHQLKQGQLKMIRDDQREYFQLKDVLIRQKKYKLQLQNQTQARLKIQSLLMEKSEEINRLSRITDTDRQQLQIDRKRKMELQETINNLNKKLSEKQKKLKDTIVHNQALVTIQRGDKKVIKQIKESLESQNNLSLFQERSIITLEANIKSLQKMIQDLKDSKHKHQTVSETLTMENVKLLETIKELKSIQYSLKETNRQLLMKQVESESLQNTKEMNSRNEVEINKQKIKSLSVQLNNKEKINSEISAKLTKLKDSIVEKEYKFQQLKAAFGQQQRQFNMQGIENKSLSFRLQAKEQQITKIKEELKDICSQLLLIKNQDIELNKTNMQLAFLQQNQQKSKNNQLQMLRRVIANYRKQIKSINNNIHPMDYWQKQGELFRLVDKYNLLQETIALKDIQIEENNRRAEKIQVQSRKQAEGQKLNKEKSLLMSKQLQESLAQIREISQSKVLLENTMKKIKQESFILIKEKEILEQKYKKITQKKCSDQISQTQELIYSSKSTETDMTKDINDKQTQTDGLSECVRCSSPIDYLSDKGLLKSHLQSTNKSPSPYLQVQQGNPLQQQLIKQQSIQQFANPPSKSKYQSPRKLQEYAQQETNQAIKSKQEEVKLKPVSKQDFTRAIKLVFLRN